MSGKKRPRQSRISAEEAGERELAVGCDARVTDNANGCLVRECKATFLGLGPPGRRVAEDELGVVTEFCVRCEGQFFAGEWWSEGKIFIERCGDAEDKLLGGEHLGSCCGCCY